jgi:O-antigen ligase
MPRSCTPGKFYPCIFVPNPDDNMRALLLLDLEGKDFSRNEKILYFLLAGFFITLYLPRMPVVNNCFIGLIVLHSFFYNSWAEKKQLLKDRKALLFIFAFFGIHILSAVFSNNKQEAITMLGLRIPLLLFPLSLGLIAISKELKFRILLIYCLTAVLAAIVCLAYAYLQYRKWQDASYLYDDSLTAVIDRQSIYFSLMVDFTLFAFTYLLLKRSFTLEHPGGAYLSIAFLLVIQFMLASRIAIIGLYCGLLVIALAYMIKQRKLLAGGALILALIVVVVGLVHFFPNTMSKFRELTYTAYQFDAHPVESHNNRIIPNLNPNPNLNLNLNPNSKRVDPEQWNGMNIRLAVWKCAWELVQQNWVLGVQLGDKQDKLMAVYRSKHFDYALATRRNMHNTYLDVLCSFGIIGLAVFLVGFLIYPAIYCYKANDALGGFILISFAISLFTETYIDKSIGCILLGFFISFLISYKKPQPV